MERVFEAPSELILSQDSYGARSLLVQRTPGEAGESAVKGPGDS